MNLYRFHFLDAAGAVIQRHPIQLPTAAAAVKLGQRMMAADGQARGLEVWHLNHTIHRSGRSAG